MQITRGLADTNAAASVSGASSHSNTRALVIVDELGRGTSPTDGLSIAWAVVESLMKQNAFVLFVTHFDQLNQMQTIYPQVRNSHLSTTPVLNSGGDGDADSGGTRLQYEFELKPGPCNQKSYGLTAAQVSGMPQSMLSVAHKVAKQLAAQKQAREEQRAQRRAKAAQETETAHELVRKLSALKGTSLATDGLALRAHLQALQVGGGKTALFCAIYI